MRYKEIKSKTIYYEKNGEMQALSINPDTNSPFKSDEEARIFAEIISELRPAVLMESNSFNATIEGKKEFLKNIVLREFEQVVNKSKAYVEGIGEIDCGVQYLINVMTLIDLCGKNGTIAFKMYDNTTKNLDLSQLKAIKTAIQTKGVQMYQKKWLLENAIDIAEDDASLDAIDIKFE